ncbi:PA domain-containing protein [Variovorax sp. HJSM1_2]|uniref:PA domain-containing protein n=1 Tax=Variovorax sp. HJSM1_2 TaxID=3366263 RepID=UPI003BD0DD9B
MKKFVAAAFLALTIVGVKATPVLQSISPLATNYTYGAGNDFYSPVGSGDADVTAQLWTTGPVSGLSGCNASDFTGFVNGSIALIERGACTFATKASYAFAAGAIGVLIYNNVSGGVMTSPLPSDMYSGPIFYLSNNLGEDFRNGASLGLTGYTVRMALTEEVTVIPEPGSLALVGLAIVALVASRRRRT